MLSIVLATIVSMVIGGIWFGPKTFYPIMQKEMGLTDEMTKAVMERFKPALHFGLVILGELVLSIMIYGLLKVTDNNLIVVVFPIFFVTISNIKTNVFTFLNIKLFLIQEGEKVLSLLAMALIISLMM